ncbi:MAG: flagellar basal-body MS-ring/collar protein FliF [Clostridia bacterium]|nr:flagellar basal-body MS-ring/collar protein FliF [Clostridia bacterium]
MNETLLQLKERVAQIWQNTGTIKKVILGVGILLLIVVLVVSFQTATKPDLRPAFTDLEPQMAGIISEKLKEKQIYMELANGGTTILVPAKDVDQVRLDIAIDKDIPVGTVGFEVFDETKFGETETERQTKLQRALQGELTRTVKQLEEVKNARVHIVLPKESLFADAQKEARASVMLELKPYKELSEEQISGLVKLVAGSVEGLKPENVTIVDKNMNNLTDRIDLAKEGANSSQLTGKQLELQRNVQKQIERDAQTMLETVLGPGKAVVRVSAELDFDQVKTTEEDWGDKQTRSEYSNEETSSGRNTGTPQGVPGTESNIGTYQELNQESESNAEKTERTRNYEIDKKIEDIIKAPGTIKRLTVAVVVDNENLPNNTQKAIEDTVSNVVGLDTNRGDKISVSGMPFDTSYEDELKKAEEEERQQRLWTLIGGISAAVVLIAILAFVFFRKTKEAEAPSEEYLTSPVLTVADLIETKPEEEVTATEMSPEEKEKAKIKGEIENLVNKDPANVAQLLKTWLAEE